MSADTPERWDARQRALLEAMGVVVWTPAPALPVAAEAAPTPVRATAAATPAPAPRTVLRAAEAAAPPAAPLGERAQRIATLDWPALREAVAACQACGLHATRQQTVFGVGHEQAQWMIVGEAPGEQEDLQGEPFVGPAGQLLDAMLRAVGRSRLEGDGGGDAAQRVFIANTLKCRPPRNRNPAPDELQHCEPFLQRQIALVQPRLILAMGKFAIQQLTGSDEPVGRLRGRVHRYQGVPVVVTYHPAYLLRQPGEKAKAWDDLRLAQRVYQQAISSAP